jgi:NAD-reducing hydrogenase large subunit
MVAQKITIEPVTRIEGHAKVTIRLNDAGKVEHAYLHINEFRGFEKAVWSLKCRSLPHASAEFARSVTIWPQPKPETPS